MVVFIGAEFALSRAVNKICPLIMEVLLCAADGDIAYLKKIRDWLVLNTFLLPLLLTNAVIMDVQDYATELLTTFYSNTVEHSMEMSKESD